MAHIFLCLLEIKKLLKHTGLGTHKVTEVALLFGTSNSPATEAALLQSVSKWMMENQQRFYICTTQDATTLLKSWSKKFIYAIFKNSAPTSRKT
jgi:hypothetical protein